MKIVINDNELDKKPSLINPMAKLVLHIDPTVLKYMQPKQLISWFYTMTDLYAEAGVVNRTLEKTVEYINHMKEMKDPKIGLKVNAMVWNYILNDQGLNSHVSRY